MGTPGDRDEGREQGGWHSEWQSGGWQSQWRQPQQPEQPYPPQQPQPQPQQPQQHGAGLAGWQQTPDGRWVQTGPGSSGKATAALVMGILGLVFCPLICSVLALVFGYQSRNEIDGSGGQLKGRGNATAGIVLGWIGVVVCVLFLILIVIGIAAGDSGTTTSPSGVPA
jgi:hypothetical protein